MQFMKDFVVVQLLFACIFVAQVSAGTVFLAPSYTSQIPFTYSVGGNAVNYLLEVCDAPQLTQCSLSVQLNLPYDRWSIPDGTFVSFQVFGDGDNCQRVLCQNNVSATVNPNKCTFTYSPTFGSKLYVVTKGGLGAVFTSVLDASFQCSSPAPSVKIQPVKTTPGSCNIPYQATRIITETTTPLSVKTSPLTSDAVQVRLSACVFSNPNNTILTLVATDTSSAFATYVCQNYPCNTAAAFAYDRSGTGFNFVRISGVTKNEITAAVYGWGKYNSTNSFILQFVQNL